MKERLLALVAELLPDTLPFHQSSSLEKLLTKQTSFLLSPSPYRAHSFLSFPYISSFGHLNSLCSSMSQYGDPNPHFWPTEQPGIQVPQHIEPEQVQPWGQGHHPHTNPNPHFHHPDQTPHPDRIQLRPRQPRHPPPQVVRPPRSPPEHVQQQSMPPSRPMHGQPDRFPLPIEPVGLAPNSQPEHVQQPSLSSPRRPAWSPPRRPAWSPPRRHQPRRQSRPVEVPPVVDQPRPHPEAHPRPKPSSSHQPRPHHVRFENGAPPPPHENLMYPTPSKTKPLTWFGAVFCCILWLVIILGGLLVLIVYLIFRPKTPHFEISSASLNAVYLDMGYLLNADLTLLTNFTNPNKKVNVDFTYISLQLYFDQHLIANQYIEPFSAVNTQNKLANVEMISSQVRLPALVIQKLVTQTQRNRIRFEVDGIFHARSNFGSLLRYSYWLYGHCIIEMAGPPSGVMVASRCRTKD